VRKKFDEVGGCGAKMPECRKAVWTERLDYAG